MERAKLIVKNFGPLKDIDIEVREMVTFIGAQASGKSTLAKLISILEDENFRRDNQSKFEDELKKYNIFSFFSEKSIISYKTYDPKSSYPTVSSFNFYFSEERKEKTSPLISFNLFKEYNKIIQPEDTQDLIESITMGIYLDLSIHSLLNNDKIYNLFKSEEEKVKFEKVFADIRNKGRFLKEEDVKNIIEIQQKEINLENYIHLYQQLIDLFPFIYFDDSIYIPSERSFLHLIEGNTMGLIKNKIQIPEHILNIGQEYEKAIQTIKELSLTIIDKNIKYKREGKTSYIYHNPNEKVNLLESASGLQSLIPILLLVEYSKSLKEEYNFNFVVEEPELNLYPKAQHELIKYLVKNCLFDRKNLILTTHSPFVLASINNLLLAYDKGQSNPKEVNKIIKKESWLNPKNFIAYELKNGKAKKIMNDKLGQISENMIDGVSDTFADEFDKLLDL
ncbi:AAA family ATPase [Flavobacterium zhairuonense]|uniref:AAA family ATPase n=1 Tax=Flavobacterium zhairuonense TaxID=2493631 RepID=UPI00104B1CC8|nr:AAA family ATPase [Flavobacterium zhairuonense]KAF2510204.1 AAA family ATPase [Flavobacterium zhairuonense]